MIVTRFAPSPTGRLHLGHAYSAVVGEQAARDAGGAFKLRIEDLDQGRSRPEYVDGLIEDLLWLGLHWDGEVVIQSQRGTHYLAALDALRAAGLVYACFCTRADIAAAVTAPHGALPRYPGTCRDLPDDPGRLAATPHSWRLDARKALAKCGLPTWREAGTMVTAGRDQIDDVILARKDAPAAYHLACVVDDAASGVTLVTRGADLRASTPVHRLLQELLGLPAPDYRHHRLIAHADGRRLAKRDRAPTLAAMRESGVDGRDLAYRLKTGALPLGFGWLEA